MFERGVVSIFLVRTVNVEKGIHGTRAFMFLYNSFMVLRSHLLEGGKTRKENRMLKKGKNRIIEK